MCLQVWQLYGACGLPCAVLHLHVASFGLNAGTHSSALVGANSSPQTMYCQTNTFEQLGNPPLQSGRSKAEWPAIAVCGFLLPGLVLICLLLPLLRSCWHWGVCARLQALPPGVPQRT
eukprot:GHRQ01016869.1.p2 GENE.GHRQ01016869.1~~GHRQ01016869.1.p2  ORF type:complete len:118 (-),score=19.36 GHRQ01016869.1:1068-1421(-)